MGYGRRRVQGVQPCSFNGDEREVRTAAARVVVTWEALQDQGRAQTLPPRTQASLQALRESLTGDLYEFRVALQQALDWVIFARSAPEPEPVMDELRRVAFPPYTDWLTRR